MDYRPFDILTRVVAPGEQLLGGIGLGQIGLLDDEPTVARVQIRHEIGQFRGEQAHGQNGVAVPQQHLDVLPAGTGREHP